LRIALAFPYGRAFVENVVEGIIDYAGRKANWRFTRYPERTSPSLNWLKGWQGDGAFVIITTPADARIARALPFPVVSINAYSAKPDVTTVTADHREIGRMAARHLLERRFRKFAYYGTDELFFSRLRRESFVSTVTEHGASCAVLDVSSKFMNAKMWMRREAELEDWLRSLQPPTAIMASTDLRAYMLLETCRRLGLRVPEEIAIVGVDNDPLIVTHSQPPLSSVARNDRLAGELAARRLAELIDRRTDDRRELILVPPIGVVARQSTETLAVEYPELAAAIQYVRDHVAEQFGVERLLSLTQWSRRHLENRFRDQIGESPYALINRLRVEQAKRLIEMDPKQLLSKVAAESGFSDPRHFRLVFRRIAGKSPTEYLRQTKK
jgi:LacI family transcriptional regulator